MLGFSVAPPRFFEGAATAAEWCPDPVSILADFWPILDQFGRFGHFLTNLGTMGGGGRPPTPTPCSFCGGGTRPLINIDPSSVPPWVSSEVGHPPSGLG